ncbi:MAG TPA: hexose kinase [Tepidisphaeraceae bacterium]|jgi:tagatose 6-phosphate kinase|nr:hexose kinase [Tepidisphaeraceae bacterium]
MILCLGTTPTVQRSMTFDGLKLDDVNRAVDVKEYASGKSPNVARVLRTMGHEPLAVGFAGGDRGKFLLADLALAGIRCDFVDIPPQTRLCTTIIDRAAGLATELVEEHSPVTADAWEALDQKLRAHLPTSKMWIFSGSLPAGAPQDFYARWVPLVRQTGATLILDARGEPLNLALKLDGFIAKLNRDELAATLHADLSTDAALIDATRRIAPANGAAIITMGSKGAIASDGKRAWRLTSPPVKAVSAVGSGDAFAAGLAMALSRGEPLPEAMKLAAACGAANAMTALAGHVNVGDVEILRSRAVVSEVY